jgi:hypothetical protein
VIFVALTRSYAEDWALKVYTVNRRGASERAAVRACGCHSVARHELGFGQTGPDANQAPSRPQPAQLTALSTYRLRSRESELTLKEYIGRFAAHPGERNWALPGPLPARGMWPVWR